MTTGSAIRHFTLDLDDLEWTGNDLVRPESVVAEPDGTLWASDARGGALRIDPGGARSEERRVGEEWRTRWRGYEQLQNQFMVLLPIVRMASIVSGSTHAS